ncbi:MAG: ATP-binding protein, partial [Bacteroidota bacterium]
DMTDKKNQLAELRLLHSVVQSAGDSILVTTGDIGNQTILYANPAHEKMTGYSLEKILGQAPTLFQGPDTDSEELEKVRRAMIRQENIQTELQHYRKNGAPFWVNMILTYVRNEAGEVTHFVYIQRDVTARKQGELELIRAKTGAEEASKAKSEFLSIMSHEIRTPLNAVIGVSGLLDGTLLDTEQKDLVHTIRQGGESLLSVVNDILDFSKIEAGKVELEEIEFELTAPIEDVLNLLRNQAFAKGLELLYEIEGDCARQVAGDPGRIRQILMNLLGNAIKFTKEGEVCLSIRVESESEEVLILHVEIADTGIGIPPEKINRLFQPFSQVDASTTRKFGGSGLGLAIVHQLVALMGGRIWIESQVNEGTSFLFTIPFQKRGSSVSTSAPKLAGKRIAIVDDHPKSLRLLAGFLTDAEVQVSAFSDPNELLEQIQTADVEWDLMLLDTSMHPFTGLNLAKQVHAHPRFASTPLLLLNAGDLPYPK